MSATTDPTQYQMLKDIILPVGGAIFGWFANQIWMSKKDRRDLAQKNYENSKELRDDHDRAYEAYVNAIAKYDAAPSADASNFVEVARAGDRYFHQLNFLCAAILSGMTDPSVRDDVMMAKIEAVADRTLSDHYKMLAAVSAKHGFSYPSEFRREDYRAIFAVVETYGL